jgi:23S rRNA (uracil1939-C5)-methyltransferase
MDACRVPAWEEETGRGLIRHLFVRSGMVCVVAAGEPVREKELTEAFRAALPELRSLIWNKNTQTGNTVLAGEFRTLWGSDRVEVTLSGLRFRLSPRSFFQVNPPQAERLYALAVSMAGLTGAERVVDLYCGAGAIGLLAAPGAREVTGVEAVSAAVDDARETAARCGISNIRFLCADAAEAAAKFAAEGMKPDVLFVDPPRKGLEASVIRSVAAMGPARVVYVSCDPATLARDLKRFGEEGYTAQKAVAVDMFPRTRHVECVTLMTKK